MDQRGMKLGIKATL